MERGIDSALKERVGLPRLPAHLEWRTVNGRPRIMTKAGAKSAGVESTRAKASRAAQMEKAMRQAARRLGRS